MAENQSNTKNTVKEAIALSVDIRNSTKLHEELDNLDEATDLIANFIEDCYVELNKSEGLYNHTIYGGDGFIMIAYTNDNEEAFDKVFDDSLKLRDIIIKYEEDWSDKIKFEAGIGISFSQINKRKIDNLPEKFNNKLFVGKSVSYSAKLCKQVPIKHTYDGNKKKRYIAFDNDSVKKLKKENKDQCYQTRSKTKYLENLKEENG